MDVASTAFSGWMLILIFAVLLLCLGLAGMASGRFLPAAAPLARWGTPVLLLLSLALLLLRVRQLDAGLNPTLFIWIPALLSAGAASFCAFCPGLAGFGAVGLAGAIGLAVTFVEAALEAAASRLTWLTLSALAVCSLAFFFSCAGLAGKLARPKRRAHPGQRARKERPAAPPPADEPPAAPDSSALPPSTQTTQGRLTLLAGPYDGQSILLEPMEELRLGSDPALCHLVLEIPSMPPCCLTIRWQAAAGSYQVTCRKAGRLLDSQGHPLPENVPVGMAPGQPLLWQFSGQPLLRLEEPVRL